MSRRLGLVLDASVWINILGTGFAESILRALGVPPVVVDLVSSEVSRHPLEATSTSPLEPLVRAGFVTRRPLDAVGLATFVSLVGADPPDDLGDGEAATISFANHNQFAAVLDERKARRIASERFPETELLSTVQILRSEEVARSLGDDLPDAVHSALSTARMRVLRSDAAWVLECIGVERARACPGAHHWLQKFKG